MFSLNCKIKVFETDKDLNPTNTVYEFDHVKDINIESGYDMFTDTATILMPKTVVESQLNNSLGIQIARRLPIDLKPKGVHEFFKQDSYIEIFLGYDGNFKPAFRGYITSVKGDAPVCIKCEDFMYVLKKHKMVPDAEAENLDDCFNPTSANPSTVINESIKDLITKRLDKLPIKIPFKCEITVDDVCEFVADRSLNIVQLLGVLKEKYQIYSFFKLGEEQSVLTITNNPMIYTTKELERITDKFSILSDGISLPKSILKRVLSQTGITDVRNFFRRDNTFIGEGEFRFHYNIIADQLKVIDLNVRKVRVRVEKYFLNSNTPIFVEHGDEGGELLKTYKIHDNKNELPKQEIKFKKDTQEVKAELTNFASLRLAEIKKTGLTGSFTTFGEPFMRPTDRVFLADAEDEEKNGVFQVDKVVRNYGLNGYRQEITLGRLVSKQKTVN